MPPLLLALAIGCGGPDSPPPAPVADGTFPTLALEQVGAPAIGLHTDAWRNQATWTLTDTNTPKGADVQEFELDLSAGTQRAVVVPFPFHVSTEALGTIGDDVTLTVGGRRLVYGGMGGGPFSWKVKGQDLVIRVPPNARTTATLRYSAADSLLAASSLSASGLPAADFARAEMTVEGHTRNGIRLTSPSTVRWPVTLPKGARFETHAALMPPLSRTQTSDGLSVVLEVVDGETVTEVGRKSLDSARFQPWSVDLSAHAGKALQIRTEVVGTPDYDVLFLGSPTIIGAPEKPVRRVLVIGLDTTRPDHFGWYGYPRPTTPELDAIANQSAVFTHAWTPAPRTRPSFRSATTGRNPLDAVGATNIGEVFSNHGFATGGIVANIHLQPRFDFDDGFDSWQYFGRADANEQVDRALAFFDAHSGQDSYLFLHFMDPHLRYGAPGAYRDMFVEDPDPDLPKSFDRHHVLQWAKNGALSDQRKEHIVSLYDGELRFLSQEIGRLVEALDALPGETLIVVHSDHGEEFWEHGGYEHNHTLFNEVTKAVLWVRPPKGETGGPVRVAQNATLADIAPTLYDFVGFTDVPALDGLSMRPYIQGKQPEPRDLGIAHLRYGLEQWGVVHDGHKYSIRLADSAESLFDLADDPSETHNLAGGKPLTPFRDALAGAHPGMLTGDGLRIDLERMQTPFTLQLGSKVAATGVYDPEIFMVSRANKAWGEPPRALASDVGTVQPTQDGSGITFTPGRNGAGSLWVLFDGAPPDLASAKLVVDGSEVSMTGTSDKRMLVSSSGSSTFQRQFIVVPPEDEAARMNHAGATGEEETCKLCQLGYMSGPQCEACL